MRIQATFCSALLSLIVSATLARATTEGESREFFERRIRPVLAQECYECHSTAGPHKAGLVLDHRAAMLTGGESGPVLVPGNPDASLLLQAIRQTHAALKMPKNGAKLDSQVLADFATWIAGGAFDPRDAAPSAEELAKETSWESIRQRRQQWWSFQPISLPPVPPGEAPQPIDRFLDARRTLPVAPPADAATLQRRLSYVLTGLPDQAGSVEELLSSPRFGERWARHWMDWLRYAESSGSEGDPAIPNAYRYRDYLIRALNADVPFDQLVREHLAGDLLTKPRLNEALHLNESALGPAHLRMCFHGFSPTDALEEQVRFTDDQIDVLSKGFLGLTVSCARCHHHKFDPISQDDFYALYGIFASTLPAQINVDSPQQQDFQKEKLTALKKDIRAALAKIWPQRAVFPNPDAAAWEQQRSDFTASQARRAGRSTLNTWFLHGQGLSTARSPAGEFRIAENGEDLLTQILPSGFHANLLSTKHNAALLSSRFTLAPDQAIYVHAAGAGEALARYVVYNYPRDGTTFASSRLNDPQLKWIRWDVTYWKGDSVQLELTPANDSPSLGKAAPVRSWFSLTDAIVQDKHLPPPVDESAEVLAPLFADASLAPAEAYATALRSALEAWSSDHLRDEQARFLNDCLQKHYLPNKSSELPEVASLVRQYRELEAAIPFPTRAPGVWEDAAFDQALMVRGDHKNPAKPVPHRFLEAIDPTPFPQGQSGRLELAEAMLSEKNPLLARVIVNRLWHHVFGRGLVATPDNFGRLGSLPSHPELLDYLAWHLRQDGWSIKRLLREMVSSNAFQLSSTPSAQALAEDPENLQLSHFSLRRLEAEAIRDTFLGIAGTLDLAMETPAVGGDAPRRSVYVNVIRTNLDPFLSVFDAPPPNSTKGRRDVTNVPAQSLTLMNSPFLLKTAQSLAESSQKNPDRLEGLYRKALGRAPTSDERTTCTEYLQQSKRAHEEWTQQHESAAREVAALQTRWNALATPHLPVTSAADQHVIAEWNFSKPTPDLTLHGGARVEQGALVLNGVDAFAASAPLNRDVTTKTLEAWVELGDLGQSGGGVLSLQSTDSSVFDAIVYAEQESHRWLAGSDVWVRTQSFSGNPENDQSPLYLAIVYEADGRITAYRQGLPYGKAYQSKGIRNFPAHQSQLLLGLRHGLPDPSQSYGNRLLRGRILWARLQDRALTATEIGQVLTDSLPSFADPTVKAAAEKIRAELTTAQAALATIPEPGDPWVELAQAVLNTKELIYLR